MGDIPEKTAEEVKTEAKFNQAQVDAIVQDRLAREKSKYSDYEDLRKFKSEHQQAQDAQQLKLLEEQKKYDEALKIHNEKLQLCQGKSPGRTPMPRKRCYC